jgi:hypothetical protein
MTANIQIITDSKKDIITVKSSALSQKGDKQYLTLLQNGVEIQVEVKTGISANGVTEILS